MKNAPKTPPTQEGVVLVALTAKGEPRCQAIAPSIGRQCKYAAVPHRDRCTRHRGKAGRPPVHGKRREAAGKAAHAADVAKLDEIAAAAGARGRRTSTAAGAAPGAPSQTLHGAVAHALNAKREQLRRYQARPVDPNAMLSSSAASLQEFVDLLDDPATLIGLFTRRKHRPPESDQEVMEFRAALLAPLAKEQRDLALAAAQLERHMGMQQHIHLKFLPLILAFGEAIRRVIRHHVQDGLLTAKLEAEILASVRYQMDVTKGNALLLAEEDQK